MGSALHKKIVATIPIVVLTAKNIFLLAFASARPPSIGPMSATVNAATEVI